MSQATSGKAMKRELTEDQVRIELLKQIREMGGKASVARKAKVSENYFSDVVAGRRSPGPKILDMLGLKKDVRVVYIDVE